MPPLSAMDVIGDQGVWDDANGCSSSDPAETHGDNGNPKDCVSRSGRKVAFLSSVEIREVEHIQDLSREQISATWYNSTEFDMIKKSMIVTLRFMIAGRPVDENHCFRGLEPRTPEGAKLRKRNRINVLKALWDAQVAQWDSETINEEAIARVCRLQSEASRRVARKAAIRDEQMVKVYQNLPVKESEKIQEAMLDSLHEGARDRRNAVREDIKQLLDNDKKQTAQPRQSSCAPSAA